MYHLTYILQCIIFQYDIKGWSLTVCAEYPLTPELPLRAEASLGLLELETGLTSNVSPGSQLEAQY